MTGQEFVKKIGPAGCVIFMLVAVSFLIICFKPSTHPVEGYAAPHDSEYYAEHIDSLKTELENNFFPLVDGELSCEIADGQLKITVEKESFPDFVKSITYYYDKELFIFEEA